MAIPESVIEEIRARANLVEIVRERIELKKMGNLWKAVCPFHADKDPSFTIYADKQIYKCFGCGKGGTVFNFLMEYEHLTFPEAVRQLGQRLGIEIPETGGDPQAVGKRERLFAVNELAVKFFRDQLKSHPAAGEAVSYLKQKRELSDEMIDRFELGFAPDSWDGLLSYLRKNKANLSDAVEAGLLIENRPGNYYDRFRDRVMFTIRGQAKKAIGFSGRLLKSEEEAKQPGKYINSPESLVFRKGSNFFALNVAEDGIRTKKRAIICEGNFDVVYLHQCGFDESVAVLGSALTERHVELIGRRADTICLLFDGDEAGKKATMKSIRLFLPTKTHPRVAVLPPGEDPDSFLRKHGGQALEKLLESAPLAMDYAVDLLTAGEMDVEQKTQAADELIELLRLIADPVRQDHYIALASQKMDVREEAVRKKLVTREARENRARRYTPEQTRKPSQGKAVTGLPDTMMHIVAYSLDNPAVARKVIEEDLCDFFPPGEREEELKNIIEARAENESMEPSAAAGALMHTQDQDLTQQLSGLLIDLENKSPEEKQKGFDDSAKRLRMTSFKTMIDRVDADIANARQKNDLSRLVELIREKQDLVRVYHELADDFFVQT